MKKILALVLALAMILMVGAAYANTIKVNNALEGEEYKAYKMLDLNYQADENGTPTAYRYTVNSAWTGFFNKDNATVTAVFTIDDQGYVTSSADSEAAWSATSALSAFAEAAAAYAKTNGLSPEVSGTVAAGKTSVDLTTGDGYYLITSTLGTRAMIDTTPGNVEVNEKNEGDTIEKEVKEDSTDSYGQSNDVQVGDTVDFRSEATIAPRSINVKIVDTMTSGLDLIAGSIHVYTDEAHANEYTPKAIKTGTNADPATFIIEISDEFAATASSSLKLYVTYQAKVNNAAVVTDASGNPVIVPQTNKTKVTFGKDSESQEDTTTTTTHKFNVYKHATGATKNLADAVFQLLKGTGTDAVKLIKIDATNYRVADATEATGTASSHANNGEIATVANGSLVSDFVTVDSGDIVIWGVDSDNDYHLHEIQAPKGYNALAADVDVTVAAANDTRVDVANSTGTELPSTGGIGTTIFYVIGGVLVIGAAIILIARRKAHD